MALTSGTSATTPHPRANWWPPASTPCVTSTSAPSAAASRAAATLPTCTKTLMPRARSAGTMSPCGLVSGCGAKSQAAATRWRARMGSTLALKRVAVSWDVMKPTPSGRTPASSSSPSAAAAAGSESSARAWARAPSRSVSWAEESEKSKPAAMKPDDGGGICQSLPIEASAGSPPRVQGRGKRKGWRPYQGRRLCGLQLPWRRPRSRASAR
ncbi:hypothetical protein LX32DRAFT_269490 [Colletotrichum zoysiae]|uniref:Uncharacterized protein n=1 Tax=Colletotrichum zoysiae TaxID=1216348 RepID=A0AAD9LWR8_9PEZI|nr:hypothetical protein LX32DRAFT_269490 [Colletotrichum zoysiae]